MSNTRLLIAGLLAGAMARGRGSAAWFLVWASLLSLAACTHCPLSVGPSASAKPLGVSPAPPHTGPVFLTDSPCPPGTVAARVAALDASTASPDATEVVLKLLAAEARRVGANAVFNLKVWRGAGGFSWVAPHASGLGVRLSDTNALNSCNGYWY